MTEPLMNEFVAANAAFVASNPTLPNTSRPTRHLTVLTCMDARVDPLRILGLELGEAKTLRNAGGRTTDEMLAAVRLVVEQLGVNALLVMHHTGCAAGTKPEDLPADLERARAYPGLEGITIMGCTYDVASGRITPLG